MTKLLNVKEEEWRGKNDNWKDRQRDEKVINYKGEKEIYIWNEERKGGNRLFFC
jgi:hypothetical protein